MKKMFVFILIVFAQNVFAQTETFDLMTYTPPKGWTKTTASSLVTYTFIDQKDKSWCRAGIFQSIASKGSIEGDFDDQWNEFAVKQFHVSTAPEVADVVEADGWKIKAGSGKFVFENKDALILLTTFSGYGVCISIVATTANQRYLKDLQELLGSIDLKKPDVNNAATTTASATDVITGTWGKGQSVHATYNDAYATSIAGYSKDQYTFNTDGTYAFISKTFNSAIANILLVKETGTYQTSANNITITPQKSVIEAWSKKDGTDKWGKLVSTQNRKIEKVTYTFTRHYFSGIQEWNLVLQSNKATQRDGQFSGNTTFSNAWYYSPISSRNTIIELPGGQQPAAEIKKEPVLQSTSEHSSLMGTWCISASDQSDGRVKNGVMSTIFRQYTFAAGSTYTFVTKVFDPVSNSMLLGKENGTYQVNGDMITILPQKSVLEEWSKKDGRDEWGKLLKSQSLSLEKATYQFTKNYIADYNEWQLLLKAGKETKRDGPFNGSSGSNTWIYIITSAARPVIKLPH